MIFLNALTILYLNIFHKKGHNMNYYIDTLIDYCATHQLHKENCEKIPDPTHRLFLGSFDDCELAIYIAKKDFFTNVTACSLCCNVKNKE